MVCKPAYRSDASLGKRTSYDPDYFARLFAIEDRHFWFKTRNRIIATLVKQETVSLSPGYRVLEIGCGTGNVLQVLEQACPKGIVMGMDLFGQGLQFARRRTLCSLVQADMYASPFATQFHLIGLFDVLEHLPDDVQVLKDLHTMLVPGGTLLLTVPAHASLWSYFDDASHHCRRYELDQIRQLLFQAGYQIDYLTYCMAVIYLPVWLGRRLAALFNGCQVGNAHRVHGLASNELRIIPWFNGILTGLLSLEAHLIAHKREMAIGTSLLAVARKARET